MEKILKKHKKIHVLYFHQINEITGTRGVGVKKNCLLFTTISTEEGRDGAVKIKDALKPGVWVKTEWDLYPLLVAMYECMPIHYISLTSEDVEVRWAFESIDSDTTSMKAFSIGFFQTGCLIDRHQMVLQGRRILILGSTAKVNCAKKRMCSL